MPEEASPLSCQDKSENAEEGTRRRTRHGRRWRQDARRPGDDNGVGATVNMLQRAAAAAPKASMQEELKAVFCLIEATSEPVGKGIVLSQANVDKGAGHLKDRPEQTHH